MTATQQELPDFVREHDIFDPGDDHVLGNNRAGQRGRRVLFEQAFRGAEFMQRGAGDIARVGRFFAFNGGVGVMHFLRYFGVFESRRHYRYPSTG